MDHPGEKKIDFSSCGKTGIVHFLLERERNLSPAELPEYLPSSEFFRQSDTIILEGKAPNWLYAFLAYRSVQEKVRTVTVRTLNEGDVTVYRAGQRSENRTARSWYSLEPDKDGFRCQIVGDRQWPADVLLQEELSFPSACPTLSVTGKGALWMYAALAAAAADSAISEVLIDNLNLSGWVSIGGKNPGRLIPEQSDVHGIAVAVVGDPNSGKSVFSRFLHTILKIAIPESWLLDCDIASPTPDWFIALCRADRKNEADLLRKKTKVGWTSHYEGLCAQRIRNTKRKLRLRLADFPGGDFRNNPPKRVPPGREVMFEAVDYFIILGKNDEPQIIQAWRQELAALGREDRIIAELVSEFPEAEIGLRFSPRPSEILRGSVFGLGRTASLEGCSDLNTDPILTKILPLLENRP